MTTLPLTSVKIGPHVRQDLGDIEALAESIRKVGLLHPIVVLSDGTLVAGRRRVAAAEKLGWESIPATVLATEDGRLEAERDENTERKDFTPSEAVAIGRLIEDAHKKKIAEVRSDLMRQNRTLRKDIDSEVNHPRVVPPGPTREKAAAAVGLSGSTYARAKTVVLAAEADPTLADVVAKMDETGNVEGALREVMQRRGGAGAKVRESHGRPPRHDMHYRAPRFDSERALVKALATLDGIRLGLADLNVEELDAAQRDGWAQLLKAAALFLSRLAKKVKP